MSSPWGLRRSATDAKLAGLCGGVAARWGVDPTLVRVGCAVLALCSGVGVVLYVAGWLLLPVEGQDRAPVDDILGAQARKWPKELWLAVVAIASLLVVGVFGSLSPFGFGPVIILALLWYFGYYKNRGPGPAAPADPRPTPAVVGPPPVAEPFSFQETPTPFTQAAQAWQRRVTDHAEQAAGENPRGEPDGLTVGPEVALRQAQGPSEPAPGSGDGPLPAASAAFWSHPDPVGLYEEPPAPTPANRRSARPAQRLRLVGLAVLGLVLSGIGVADIAGAEIAVTTYLAAALLVVGLTLVAATWWGRARGILPVGLILAMALAASAATGPVVERVSVADRSYAAAADLPSAGDTLDTGRLAVDLSRLPVTRNLSYTAYVGLGSLEVRVPPSAAVRIVYRIADGGTLLAYDKEIATGAERKGVVEPADPAAGAPVLTLNLSVDRGAIQVFR